MDIKIKTIRGNAVCRANTLRRVLDVLGEVGLAILQVDEMPISYDRLDRVLRDVSRRDGRVSIAVLLPRGAEKARKPKIKYGVVDVTDAGLSPRAVCRRVSIMISEDVLAKLRVRGEDIATSVGRILREHAKSKSGER